MQRERVEKRIEIHDAEGRHGHLVEKAHPASEHDAGNGQGTVHGWARGMTQDHPILDGSMQSAEAERQVDNPWRGIEDPALTRHPGRVRHGERYPIDQEEVNPGDAGGEDS